MSAQLGAGHERGGCVSVRMEPGALLRGDTGATGVVASPVYSPNGLVYVGSTDSYFYAVENRTGAVRWAMFADGPVQSSAAVDEDGKLFFATDAGTIYQIADPPEGA